MAGKYYDDDLWGNRRRRRFRALEHPEDIDPDRYTRNIRIASESSSGWQRIFNRVAGAVSRWFGVMIH